MTEQPSEVQMRDASPTMFGCPRWSPDERYDVVFVGVPSDIGGLGHRSPATAPGFLRSTSALFPVEPAGPSEGRARAKGWFDYTTQKTLLAGARLADAGDFPCLRPHGMAGLDPLPEVYATLRETTRLLVILGGDHSVAHAMAKTLDGDGVVWLDAHEDAADPDGPYPDCANVVRYLDAMDTVPAIAQLGLRGIVPANRAPPPSKRRLCASSEEVVSTLAAASVRSAAVSIDVDVFDPSLMPAVGSPMPEGLGSREVLGLFHALRAAGVAIPILEIAEYAPVSEHDIASGLFLVHFLLRAIDLSLSSESGGG